MIQGFTPNSCCHDTTGVSGDCIIWCVFVRCQCAPITLIIHSLKSVVDVLLKSRIAVVCCVSLAAAVAAPQAYYDSSPMLPPEGSIKGPCLLGSLSYLVDEFDWEGESRHRHE